MSSLVEFHHLSGWGREGGWRGWRGGTIAAHRWPPCLVQKDEGVAASHCS